MPLMHPLQVSDLLMVPYHSHQITGIYHSNLHKILIFFQIHFLEKLCAARIDELTESNKPAVMDAGSKWNPDKKRENKNVKRDGSINCFFRMDTNTSNYWKTGVNGVSMWIFEWAIVNRF